MVKHMQSKKQSPRTIAGRDEIVLEHQDSERLLDMLSVMQVGYDDKFASEIVDTLVKRHRIDAYDTPPLVHNVPTEGIKGRIIAALWHQKQWGRGGGKC